MLATRLIEYLEQDKNSRADWEERAKRGLQLAGVIKSPQKNAPDADKVLSPGHGQVKLPLIMEAATHFQARAMARLSRGAPPN